MEPEGCPVDELPSPSCPGVGKTPYFRWELAAKLSSQRNCRTDQDTSVPSLFSDSIWPTAERRICLDNEISLPVRPADSSHRCGTRRDFSLHRKAAAGTVPPSKGISGIARSMTSIAQIVAASSGRASDSGNTQGTPRIPKAF